MHARTPRSREIAPSTALGLALMFVSACANRGEAPRPPLPIPMPPQVTPVAAPSAAPPAATPPPASPPREVAAWLSDSSLVGARLFGRQAFVDLGNQGAVACLRVRGTELRCVEADAEARAAILPASSALPFALPPPFAPTPNHRLIRLLERPGTERPVPAQLEPYRANERGLVAVLREAEGLRLLAVSDAEPDFAEGGVVCARVGERQRCAEFDRIADILTLGRLPGAPEGERHFVALVHVLEDHGEAAQLLFVRESASGLQFSRVPHSNLQTEDTLDERDRPVSEFDATVREHTIDAEGYVTLRVVRAWTATMRDGRVRARRVETDVDPEEASYDVDGEGYF